MYPAGFTSLVLRTGRRTIIRFLIELKQTFSSPNMVRTVRRTLLPFLLVMRGKLGPELAAETQQTA